MNQSALLRAQQSYRHEAFLWRTPADFTDMMVPFVEEGLAADEPVMVALTAEHTQWLHESLSDSAVRQVEFVDMARLGHNPARIIPAWRDFVSTRSDSRQPVRGIGEPIWPGRHAEELLECQLHEALLNLAIDPATPLWLVCPYHAGTLSAEVLHEAQRSHPVIVEAGSHRGSAHYGGRSHVDALFGAGLSAPLGTPRASTYTETSVRRLVAYVRLELHVAGLPADQAGELAAATRILALGSLRRGSSEVSIRIWEDPDAVICEVTDDMPMRDPLHGRTLPKDEHEGLWHVNQVCDLVQLRSTEDGTTVRILTWKPRH